MFYLVKPSYSLNILTPRLAVMHSARLLTRICVSPCLLVSLLIRSDIWLLAEVLRTYCTQCIRPVNSMIVMHPVSHPSDTTLSSNCCHIIIVVVWCHQPLCYCDTCTLTAELIHAHYPDTLWNKRVSCWQRNLPVKATRQNACAAIYRCGRQRYNSSTLA